MIEIFGPCQDSRTSQWSFPQVNSATDSESQRLWLGRENGEPQSGWLMIFPLKQPHFRGPNLIKIYYNHETSHHYLLKYLHIFGHKLEIHPNFHNTSTTALSKLDPTRTPAFRIRGTHGWISRDGKLNVWSSIKNCLVVDLSLWKYTVNNG